MSAALRSSQQRISTPTSLRHHVVRRCPLARDAELHLARSQRVRIDCRELNSIHVPFDVYRFSEFLYTWTASWLATLEFRLLPSLIPGDSTPPGYSSRSQPPVVSSPSSKESRLESPIAKF